MTILTTIALVGILSLLVTFWCFSTVLLMLGGAL